MSPSVDPLTHCSAALDVQLSRAEAGDHDRIPPSPTSSSLPSSAFHDGDAATHPATEATASQTEEEPYCSVKHYSTRNGWLRALVLGANDGIVSVGALVIGVAAASTTKAVLITSGVSGLVAGALSMGMGEYVSVSAQRDAEEADYVKETQEHLLYPDKEMLELARIFEERGIPAHLARQVAEELHKGDAVSVHMREEIGITEISTARPLQAGLVSMASFTTGALWPVIAAAASPEELAVRIILISAVSFLALFILGWIGSSLGGARVIRGTLRTVITGTLAMTATALIGWGVGKATGASGLER